MLVHRSLEKLNIQRSVVTTGSFDGVHVGHRTIIDRLKAIATEIDGVSVLVTFYPHPRKILYPNTQGKDLQMINTQREKILLLEQAGLDHLVIIPFSLEFSKTTSVDFIRKILVGKLHASCVVVGFNHHFGHNREGDYDYLHELGKYYDFAVEEIPEQDIHNEFVSSTKIRKAILEGNIQRANAYLDHEYFILAPVKPVQDLSGQTGLKWFELFPEEPEKQLTLPGVYAGSITEDSRKIKVLVLITETPDGCRILIHTPEFDLAGIPEVNLAFNKRIRQAKPGESIINPGNFSQDIEEIGELIY
ncbi:MAG: FAD synthetase family protein [Bacteroidales bacterium]|jgi:riboflavin kinase/FMN adenylyltransferase